MRTFTGEGVYYALRGGTAGIILPLLAAGEYVADLLPQTPARTQTGPLLARCASGAFMGWNAARAPGAALGLAGALAGTFGGYRMRMALIERIGAVPAALAEDAIALTLAFAAAYGLGKE